MAIRINNFKDLAKSLLHMRYEFNKSVESEKHIIEKPINLFFQWMNLIKSVAIDIDDESYILEVLSASFRKLIASYILMESGLIRESAILMRNYIELILIAIDITYNQTSLNEWKNSKKDEIFVSSRDDWYFKKAKIANRIQNNDNNNYPEYWRNIALGKNKDKGRSLIREWSLISNIAGHEHASSQLKPMIKDAGHFSILETATNETYHDSFINYRLYLIDIISLLIRIPKYRDKISNDSPILEEANRLSQEYDKLISEALSET